MLPNDNNQHNSVLHIQKQEINSRNFNVPHVLSEIRSSVSWIIYKFDKLKLIDEVADEENIRWSKHVSCVNQEIFMFPCKNSTVNRKFEFVIKKCLGPKNRSTSSRAIKTKMTKYFLSTLEINEEPWIIYLWKWEMHEHKSSGSNKFDLQRFDTRV